MPPVTRVKCKQMDNDKAKSVNTKYGKNKKQCK
jgi:hypothetical protein